MRNENYDMRILNSCWYNWPNCVAQFETAEEINDAALIGIVKAQNIKTKEIKQYIGIGKGQNQREDELRILDYGIPFCGAI